jgi:hypothetical protein
MVLWQVPDQTMKLGRRRIDSLKARARVVAPSYLSTHQPVVSVVRVLDIKKLASFAPKYTHVGEEMESPKSWYVYDVLHPLQSQVELFEKVDAQMAR